MSAPPQAANVDDLNKQVTQTTPDYWTTTYLPVWNEHMANLDLPGTNEIPSKLKTKISFHAFIQSHHHRLSAEFPGWYSPLLRSNRGTKAFLSSSYGASCLFRNYNVCFDVLLAAREAFFSPRSNAPLHFLIPLVNGHLKECYLTICFIIRHANPESTLEFTSQIPTKIPLLDYNTSFNPKFHWFRYILSKFTPTDDKDYYEDSFYAQVLGDTADARDAAFNEDLLASMSPPFVSKPSSLVKTAQIHPFTPESSLKNELANSYTEHLYYQSLSTSTTNTAASSDTHPTASSQSKDVPCAITQQPRPLDVQFDSYRNLQHPVLKIKKDSMADLHTIETPDYHFYAVWMFILGDPTEFRSLLLETLSCAVSPGASIDETSTGSSIASSTALSSTTTSVRPTTTHATKYNQIYDRLHLLYTTMRTNSIGLCYMVQIFNYRVHLHQLSSTSRSTAFPLCARHGKSHSDAMLRFLDPLLWSLPPTQTNHATPLVQSQAHHHHTITPYKVQSHVLHNWSHLQFSDPASTDLEALLDEAMSGFLRHIAESSMNSTTTALNPVEAKQAQITATEANAFFNAWYLHHLRSPHAPLAYFAQLTKIALNPKSSTEDHFLRHFVEHSFHQYQSNLPTLYQHLHSHCLNMHSQFNGKDTLDDEDMSNRESFLHLLLLGPFFLFEHEYSLLQKHIILAAHSCLLNTNVSTYFQYPGANVSQTTTNTLHRTLLPFSTVVYTWLMMKSGLTSFFEASTQGASSLFYHVWTGSRYICPGGWEYYKSCISHISPSKFNQFAIANEISLLPNPLLNRSDPVVRQIKSIIADTDGEIWYARLNDESCEFSTETTLISTNPTPHQNDNLIDPNQARASNCDINDNRDDSNIDPDHNEDEANHFHDEVEENNDRDDDFAHNAGFDGMGEDDFDQELRFVQHVENAGWDLDISFVPEAPDAPEASIAQLPQPLGQRHRKPEWNQGVVTFQFNDPFTHITTSDLFTQSHPRKQYSLDQIDWDFYCQALCELVPQCVSRDCKLNADAPEWTELEAVQLKDWLLSKEKGVMLDETDGGELLHLLRRALRLHPHLSRVFSLSRPGPATDYNHTFHHHRFDNPNNFTEINLLESTQNEALLNTAQIKSLQKQYREYRKELHQCESDLVSEILKTVIFNAHSAGLLDEPVNSVPQSHQVLHENTNMFTNAKSYPFPSPTPIPSTLPSNYSFSTPSKGRSDEMRYRREFSKWCVEMLLVSSLHLQPFIHSDHFDFIQPLSQRPTRSPSQAPQLISPELISKATTFLTSSSHHQRFVSAMHVEPMRSTWIIRLNRSTEPWFLYDALQYQITNTTIACYQALFSLSNPE